jgi:multidrug resistance efflux pump
VDISIRARGVVRPNGEAVRVVSEAGGQILSIHLEEGASIRRGDILVQLDTREIQLKERSLEAGIHFVELRLAGLERRIKDTAFLEERAIALETIDTDAASRMVLSNLDQAERRFARASRLYAAGLTSRQAYDETHTALSQARAEQFRLASRSAELKREQIQARLRDLNAEAIPLRAELANLYHQLEQAGIERGRFSITSPCDGELTSAAPLHVAETLAPGTAIATIVPKGHSLVVESWIPSPDRLYIDVGMPARLQTEQHPALPDRALDAEVISISPDARFTDSQANVFRVLAVSSESSDQLRLGMTFQVRFITQQQRLLWLLFRRIKQGFSMEE